MQMRAKMGLLLIAAATPAFPQSVESVIERLTAEWMTALGNKDDATLNRLMAEEFLSYAPESGKYVNRTEWLRQARISDSMECEVRSLQVRSYVEFAVASGRVVCKGEIRGIGMEEDSVVADTWVRRDGQWKVSTRIAATSPRFTGIWAPLAIGAALPTLLWFAAAVRRRMRQGSSLISSANRPYY